MASGVLPIHSVTERPCALAILTRRTSGRAPLCWPSSVVGALSVRLISGGDCPLDLFFDRKGVIGGFRPELAQAESVARRPLADL